MKTQDIVSALNKATPGISWKHDETSDELNFTHTGNHVDLPGTLWPALAKKNIGIYQIHLKRTGAEVKIILQLTANG